MARRVSSPHLIGRDGQLTALDEALADARHGRGRLMLIEGEAGLGKTRLVEAFLARVGDVRVVTGGGIPLGADAPYAPMIDIFRTLAALHPPAASALLSPTPASAIQGFIDPARHAIEEIAAGSTARYSGPGRALVSAPCRGTSRAPRAS